MNAFKNNLFVLFFIFCNVAIAQLNYTVEHYGLKEGLPSACIYDSEIDKNGFLILATDVGLIQYDGLDFKKVDLVEKLPDINILSIKIDSLNNYYLNVFNNGIFQVKPNHEIIKLTFQSKSSFLVNGLKNSYLYYSVGNKSYLNDINMNNWSPDSARFSKISVFDFEIEKNFAFLGTNTGLIKYDFKTKSENLEFKNDLITCVKCFDDFILVCKQGKLMRVNYDLKVQKEISLGNEGLSIEELLFLNDSNFFYTNKTSDKLYYYKNGSTYLINSYDNVYWKVNCLSIDKRNFLWIGTANNGLFKVNFSDFIPIQSNPLFNLPTNSFILKSDKIIIATSNGIFYKENKSSQIKKINLFAKNVSKCHVSNIFEYKPGSYLALANFLSNKSYFDKESNYHLSAYNYSNLFRFKIINGRSIVKLNNDYIIGGWNGWFELADSTLSVIHSFNIGSNLRRINKLLKIDNGVIAATDLGIAVFNSDFKIKVRFDTLTRYNCCFLTLNGTYVFGGNEKIGFYRDGKFNSFEINDEVKTIYYEKNNRLLFFGTKNGILIYDDKVRSLKKTYLNSEKIGSEVNEVSYVDDTVFIATNLGLFKSSLNDILNKQKDIFPISFSKFSSNFRTIFFPSTELFIKSDENSLALSFSKPFFDNFNKVIYKYQLNDQKEIITNRCDIVITELPYGLNKLKVYTCLDSFTWSLEKNVVLVKEYPFYYQWWFILFVVLFLALIVSVLVHFIIKYRVDKVKKENLYQTLITEYKFKSIGNNTNTHFLSNALTSIQQYILNGDVINASDYLAKISRLQRLILNAVQQNLHSIEEELFITDKYIELELLRFNEKIQVNKIGFVSPENKSIMVPPLILQPIIENVFKHAFKGSLNEQPSLSITIINQIDSVSISIEDNGKGFDFEAYKLSIDNTSSYGLKSVIERINLNDSIKLEILSVPSIEAGTRTKITFCR